MGNSFTIGGSSVTALSLPPHGRSRRAWSWAGLASLALHGTLIPLTAGAPAPSPNYEPPVELEVGIVETSPPAPEPDPPAALPQPSPEPREKPVTPPSPSREPAPQAESVSGVSVESMIDGESPLTVPVGNTLTSTSTVGPATIHASAPGRPGMPSEAAPRIVSQPRFLDVDAVYPPQAEREAIAGTVVLEVDVDREGKVRAITVLKRAGYGMDESAVRAVWRARVKPARTQDGLAVDYKVKHTVHFRPARAEPEEEF